MIKAIIFDFGNVLSSFDNDVFLKKLASHSSLSFDVIKRLIYVDSDVTRRFETGKISTIEFFDEVSKSCRLSMSKDNFIDAYSNIFSPIRETRELVKSLNGKFKLGLLSNTCIVHFEREIVHCGVFDLFDAVSTSFEVGVMKPDKAIYLDCVKKLNLKPSECVFIDDLDKNIVAARQLGFVGVQFTSFDALVKSLSRLGVL